MNEKATGTSTYRIEVEGHLHEKWAVWLGETIIRIDNLADDRSVTQIIVDVPDQAGLRGLLNKLWDLNLPLLAVTRLSSDEAAHDSAAAVST